MKDLLQEYGTKFVDDHTETKLGYCKRCLNERWRDATEKKLLYRYELNNDIMYICLKHVGCMEIAREIIEHRKPMNDLEKRKHDKQLEKLIENGEKLVKY